MLDAALTRVDTHGAEALHMRELARAVGVSSGAPFRHFADKQILLEAVADRAADLLDRALEDATAADDDALTQFRAIAVAYVRFAAEHPALFDLICRSEMASARFLGAIEDERRRKLIALIVEGQNAGLIREADPELLALTSEAVTHGLARMIVERHTRVRTLSSEDARKLVLAMTQLLQSSVGLG